MNYLYRLFILCAAGWCGNTVLRAILKYGVNVPFEDQWELLRVLREVDAGRISWARALLLNVGEHRVGLELLISDWWWRLTAMDLRSQMVLNWCLAAVFCAMAAVATRRALPGRSSIPWTVLGAAGMFVFNPAAYQSWLWGLPPVHLLVPLLFVGGVILAQSGLREAIKIPGVALCALLASFTLMSGLLLWGLFIPVVAMNAKPGWQRRWPTVAAALLLAVSIGAYAAGGLSSPTRVAGIVAMLQFLLAYTGNLMAGATDAMPVLWAEAAGLALTVFFAAAAWLAWLHLRGKALWPATVIWLCLGGYSLAAGAMAAAGRAGFGVPYAIKSSRYVLASSFLPVACVVLGALLTAALVEGLPARVHLYSWVLCSTMALVFTATGVRAAQTNRALAAMTNYHYWQTRGKVAMAAANVIDLPEFRNVHTLNDPASFKRLVNYMNSRGWVHPPLWDEAYLRRLAAPERMPEAGAGVVERLTADGATVRATGWGRVPEAMNEQPDAVILLESAPEARPRVLAVVFPTELRSGGLPGARWSAEIVRYGEPPPGSRIRCFAYHAANGRASLMGGG